MGKESNRLEDLEVGLVEDLGEVQSECDDYYSRIFDPLVLPILRVLGARKTARGTGHSVSAVSEALRGRSRPRIQQLQRYQAFAASHCSAVLKGRGVVPPEDPIACLRSMAIEAGRVTQS